MFQAKGVAYIRMAGDEKASRVGLGKHTSTQSGSGLDSHEDSNPGSDISLLCV